jgi:hypothetical protein
MLRPVLLWFLGISVSIIILLYLFYVVYQIEAGLALQALALTGGLGLTGQSTATKMLRLPAQSACEQAPAGKGLSRQGARNSSFST